MSERVIWSPETLEVAYQVWSGVAGRNGAETRRQLAVMGYGTIPYSTLNQWVAANGWHDRAAAELVASVRIPVERHVSTLQVAGVNAVDYLSKVTSGAVPPDPDRIRAAIHLETAARSLILKQADSDRRQLKRERSPAARDVSAMSSDELEQYERERREQRGSAG